MQTEIDVLIVGAGPIGLNMALALTQQNIRCRIIDKNPHPSNTSNTVLVNSRTLEIWDTEGISNSAINQGLKLKQIALFNESKQLNHATFDQIDSKYNYFLTLPQSDTETILIAQLNQYNVAIEWNSQVVTLQDSPECVHIVCQHMTHTEEINAKWVIGCDGYNSTVRLLAQFSTTTQTLPQNFIMMDGVIESKFSPDSMNAIFHPLGVLFFLPLKNTTCIVAEISHDVQYADLTDPTEKIFRDILSQRCPQVQLVSVEYLSHFKIQEQLVDNFIKGHVILAGDAAHSHSSAGGQGMNTGIQDTWNLSWKLAHVIKKQADTTLLDSYNIERIGIAHDVLKRSGGLTSLSSTNNKFIQLLRNLGVEGILSIDLVRKKVVNSLAQTDICYLNSPLIDSKQVLYQNQLRYISNTAQWLLLSKDVIVQHNLPTFTKIQQDSLLWSDQPLCLIRPDGYIAMYADSLFEIESYFVEHGIHD